jgi:hypothetical protein
MEERRSTARRRILKGATIAFDGGVTDCVVRNLSPLGAGLAVDNSWLGIPHEFELVMTSSQARYPSRVIWRGPRWIGISFATRACGEDLAEWLSGAPPMRPHAPPSHG